jgi:hypothetical protein
MRKLLAALAIAGTVALGGCASAPHVINGVNGNAAGPIVSATPAQHKPAAVPVLKPGRSATFRAAQQDGPPVIMRWTMGGSVVRVPDNSVGHGFEDVAFNLTIRDAGTTAQVGDPVLTPWLLARSPGRRTDETLQGTAALNIYDGTHGLNGSDLELESGVQPGAHVSGYVSWPVPSSTTTVFVLNPNTGQPELQIDLGSRQS